jgi:hypothetical protein
MMKNIRTFRCLWILILLPYIFTACVTSKDQTEVTEGLNIAEVTAYVPAQVKDRSGWAEDIFQSIAALSKAPTTERVCAVIAVVEQESGFQANPQVVNLPQIVRGGILKKFEPLGILAEPAVKLLLAGKAPGATETFENRIAKLRTERDLDQFFRDMAAAYHGEFPGPYAIASVVSKLMGKGYLAELNPVTTAGSMQVKVSFAKTLDEANNKNDEEIRDWIYTRAGGLRVGTARLLGYDASYDDIIYRFADYNSGIYSSRNAAFQEMLGHVTGQKLTFDGDILAYDQNGIKDVETKSLSALLAFARKNDIWEWTVQRDAKKEKTQEFEETTSWEKVRDAWKEKTNKDAPYARMPSVLLSSPKLSKTRSTEWFATNVKKRYSACRDRGKQ